MSNAIQITSEGLKTKQEDLSQLIGRRNEILNDLKFARELGDLSENSEYSSARENLGIIESRIKEIETILENYVIVDPKTAKVLDISSNIEKEYFLVSQAEANFAERKIAINSPLGQAIINGEVGKQVEVKAPKPYLIKILSK
jgi:transcription elongation factor GreA